jgi:hypothetical protein
LEPGASGIKVRSVTGSTNLLGSIHIILQRISSGHVARIGKKKNAYRILVGKPERKKPLGRSRRRWVYNIKMNLREIK